MPDERADAAPLTLRGVTLTLPSTAGPVEILRGVDFAVAAGERVAVVGPSGCGKSSLIAVAAGLERPTSGTVELLGQDCGGSDEDGRSRLRRGRVSLVFQSFHLLPNMTARRTSAPLEIAGRSGAAKTAGDWLGRVGLTGRAGHYPHQLSGGEQQRVALARALAARPALLFADEPTGNLDAANAELVAELMFDLVGETGAALVLVTHDPSWPPGPTAWRGWRTGGWSKAALHDTGRREARVPLRRSGAARRGAGLSHLPGLPGPGRGGDRGGWVHGRGLSPGAGQPGPGDSGRRSAVERRPAAVHRRRARRFRPYRAVDYAVASQAMAQAPSGERRLVELRGVGPLSPGWPGRALRRGQSQAALAPVGDAAGAAVEQPLLDRLGLKLGDRFLVGNVPVVARAVLISEPDRLGRGFALGPRVLTRMRPWRPAAFSAQACRSARRRASPSPPAAPLTVKADLKRAPGMGELRGGYRLRDRNDAAPGAQRLIDQLEYFLGFIGLASLVAGGLGVAGAVSAYLETRKARSPC
jgi:putative ABC transport system ATP-binding protein